VRRLRASTAPVHQPPGLEYQTRRPFAWRAVGGVRQPHPAWGGASGEPLKLLPEHLANEPDRHRLGLNEKGRPEGRPLPDSYL